MAGDADKREENARHIYGPRSLAALVPLVSRPAYKRRSPAAAHLLAEWEAIVGPAVAAVSTPRKLFAGTLSIAAGGPTALELQHRSAQLIERINRHLGQVAVSRLRFVQDFSARPAASPMAPPPPRAKAAGDRAVAHLPAGELRDALARLGAVVLADRSGRRA